MDKKPANKKAKKLKPVRKAAPTPDDSDGNDEPEDDAEEWGGISDAGQEVAEEKVQPAQPEMKESRKGDKKKDAKAKDKKAQQLVAKRKLENQFGMLLESCPDEEDEGDGNAVHFIAATHVYADNLT